MENLSTITCGTFLEELASKAPTPGGGAASALCGAVAAAVFGKFMAAYKMPKTTDEEKAARTAAIQQAAIAAADVPMQIAEKSMEVLLLARRIIVTGNPNAISDGTVSAIVARAALRSALYNVKINLGLIKDAAYVEQAEAKMQMLEAKALETEAFVLARTDEILK